MSSVFYIVTENLLENIKVEKIKIFCRGRAKYEQATEFTILNTNSKLECSFPTLEHESLMKSSKKYIIISTTATIVGPVYHTV